MCSSNTINNLNLFRIVTPFESLDVNQEAKRRIELYQEAIRNILEKIFPPEFFNGSYLEEKSVNHIKDSLRACLPHFNYSSFRQPPFNMSFFILTKYRPNAFKFFFEMISCWLVPGRRLNVVLLYAADFYLPELTEELYTVCEVILRIESVDELEHLQRNLPIIETELNLGIPSAYYATRILEIKGLSSDEKTVKIQEYVAYLVKRLPRYFTSDVFTEMQHAMVICSEEFKNCRGWRHLSRIISVLYLFRKGLKEAVQASPHKRHVRLKLFKAILSPNSNSSPKKVLGLVIGVNFLKDKEVLEEKHVIQAIQNTIPNAQAVPTSFFVNKMGSETLRSVYLEIEKNDGKDFSLAEIQKLRKRLPIDVKECIEHLMRPVFMPSNEEEIIRNIVSLSNQIKYVSDLPQVIISFEKQTSSHLVFIVILARVLKERLPSIKEMFKKAVTPLKYFHDRCRVVGHVRKKYEKEVTVFKVNIPQDHFLHNDHVIDLVKARQQVASELSRIVGEVRDFNGGMISKQNELLCAFHNLLGDKVKYPQFLLKHFFYSLTPGIMRNVLEPQALKTLFMMMLEGIENNNVEGEHGFSLKIHTEPNCIFAMVVSNSPVIQEEINKELEELTLTSTTQLVRSFVNVYDKFYIGLIYQYTNFLKQLEFCQALELVCKQRPKVGVLQE